MSTFVPTKRNLREGLLMCFHLKQKAVEAQRTLTEAYGDYAPSTSTCEYWFRRFKRGDFDTDDKERPGQPKKFADEELEALLDENPSHTLQELSDSLGVDLSTVGKRLKAIHRNVKSGNIALNENVMRSSVSDGSLSQRHFFGENIEEVPRSKSLQRQDLIITEESTGDDLTLPDNMEDLSAGSTRSKTASKTRKAAVNKNAIVRRGRGRKAKKAVTDSATEEDQ